MIFVVLVTLVSLLITPENALRTPPSKVRAQRRIFPSILHKQNRDELKKIIHALNSRSDRERTKEVNDAERFAYSFETKKLEEVMKLIQNNYDANNLRKKNKYDDGGVRIHVIRNPEILEQYVKSIKEGAYKSSDASGDSGDSDSDALNSLRDSYLRDYLSRLLIERRSAKFRLDRHDSMDLKDDNDIKEGAKPQKKQQQSYEDQITPFYNSYENKKESNLKESTTKKQKKKNKINKIKPKSKSKSKSKTKKSSKDDWDVTKHYSKEDQVGIESTEKRANNWWDDAEKDDFNKHSGWDLDDTVKRQPKSITKKKLKVPITKDPWGSAEADWGKKPKKVYDYFHDDPKKVKDDFQDEVSFKKEDTNNKRKKTDNWDQPKVEAKADGQPENADWSNEKETWTKWTKKNEWDGYEKTTRFRREPKRKPKEYFKEPSYKAYVKPRERMGKDGFHLFGRTPIPLVGKQGIYEEQ